jgi:hypothetical protein
MTSVVSRTGVKVSMRRLMGICLFVGVMAAGGGLWASGAVTAATSPSPGQPTTSGAGQSGSVGVVGSSHAVTLTDVTGDPSSGAAWGLASNGANSTLVQMDSNGVQNVGTVQGRNGTLIVSGSDAWLVQGTSAGVTLTRYSTANAQPGGSTDLNGLDPSGVLLDTSAVSSIVVAGLSTPTASTSSSATPSATIAIIDSSTASVAGTVNVTGVPTALTGSSGIAYLSVTQMGPTGQETFLATIQTSPTQVTYTVKVPYGFTPEAVAGSWVWGVEQSTGQVLASYRSQHRICSSPGHPLRQRAVRTS